MFEVLKPKKKITTNKVNNTNRKLKLKIRINNITYNEEKINTKFKNNDDRLEKYKFIIKKNF